MDLNHRLVAIVETIMAARLKRGEKLTQDQIAEAIGRDRAHFNSALNGKRKATKSLIAFLERTFAEDLAEKPGVPGDIFNRERAQIKALWHHVAKLEAAVFNISLEQSLNGLEDDTIIAKSDLETA